MQNRYVGDVGDFGKYGLLRHLMGTHERLGVVWYLAPPESNGDGRHLSYLAKPTEYRGCDPTLFDGLQKLVNADQRSVAAVVSAGLLPASTVSFDEMVCPSDYRRRDRAAFAQRMAYREGWAAKAIQTVQECDLLFLDPDNGIGGKSFRPHGCKGHKHIAWGEIGQFARPDRTLVIYHHTGRSAPAVEQAWRLIEGFREKVSTSGTVIALGFRRGTHRIFLIATHQPDIEATVGAFLGRWGAHWEILACHECRLIKRNNCALAVRNSC